MPETRRGISQTASNSKRCPTEPLSMRIFYGSKVCSYVKQMLDAWRNVCVKLDRTAWIFYFFIELWIIKNIFIKSFFSIEEYSYII